MICESNRVIHDFHPSIIIFYFQSNSSIEYTIPPIPKLIWTKSLKIQDNR